MLAAVIVATLVLGLWAAAAVAAAVPVSAQELTPSAMHAIVVAPTYGPDEFRDTPAVVDRLHPGAVVRVRVFGFDELAEAVARQCITLGTETCGNPMPVQFGSDGNADFQYQLTDDFATDAVDSGCRAFGPPCRIVVTPLVGEDRAELLTVFGDPAPPPASIDVTPQEGLIDGQSVAVAVAGFPPGAQVEATLCAPPDVTGAERCGTPGPTAPLTVGPDGTGEATLEVRTGPVGSEGRRCAHDRPCAVSVFSDDVFARAPVVPVRFAAPRARYDPVQTTAGLAAATLFLGTAAWLVRRTDWSPVGETKAPEIDDSEFADLDAIVASLPEES